MGPAGWPSGQTVGLVVGKEEEELEFYDLSALYRLFELLYSHIYGAYRGKKG